MKKLLDGPVRLASPPKGASEGHASEDPPEPQPHWKRSPMGRDSELIRRIAEGDPLAFEELYGHYRGRVASFLARVMRGTTRLQDQVDEAVNDTMVAVWRRASSFRGEARASTWILGIAYRVALKSLRSARRHRDEVPVEEASLVATGGPEESYSQRERADRLRRGLDQLSASHRAVVELAFFEGYSYREIGAIVDCPVNTVKTRMFHARRQLRKHLEADSGLPSRPRLEIVPPAGVRDEESE